MNMTRITHLVLTAAALLAAGPAMAQTQYDDEAEFLAAVTDPILIDFEGFIGPGEFQDLGNPGSFSSDGVTFTSNSPMFLQNNATYGTDTFLSPQQSTPEIVEIDVPENTVAFGFSYSSNEATALLLGGDSYPMPAVPPATLGFFGVAGDTEIFGITVTVAGPGIDIDNVWFATDPTLDGEPPTNDGDGMNNIPGGGDLVPTFGNGGTLLASDLLGVEEGGFSVLALQSSGLMIVAGNDFSDGPSTGNTVAYVARLDETGALDASFGSNGYTTWDLVTGLEKVRDIEVLPDDSIIVSGGVSAQGIDSYSYVAKFTPDGTPDATFGTNGIATDNVAVGFIDAFERVAVQDDGRLWLGTRYDGIYRYLPDGTRDPAIVRTVLFGPWAAFGLDVDSDRSIVSGGGPSLLDSAQDFIVIRHENTGGVDYDFGTDGVSTVDVSNFNSAIIDIVIDEKGRVLALGSLDPVNDTDESAIIRLLPDGTPDPGFGTNGVVRIDLPDRTTYLRKIELRPDGGILLSGQAATQGARFELIVVSLHENGSLDTGFAGQGWRELDVYPNPPLSPVFRDFFLGGLQALPSSNLAVLDWSCNCMALMQAPDWFDNDGDGIGDRADPDDDNDGVPDELDDYPFGRFADTPTDYWAFRFVEAFARAGITGGCGNDNYCPEDEVTRAQMAVFLERAMRGSGYTPPAATGAVFADVSASDFAAAFIEQLAADGITGGCGGGNYCPAAPVTRAQMAVFLLRARYGPGYSPPAATGTFADVGPNDFAAAFIEQLAAEGITGGCGGGNFCPQASVTRAQMAVFLVRTFGL